MNPSGRVINESDAAKRAWSLASQPTGPREALEDAEDGREVLRDAVAERLAELGCGRGEAARLADAVMGVVGEGVACGGGDDTAREQAEEMLRGMLAGVVLAERPRLEARVCLVALGIGLDDAESMRRIGRDFGYSPEGVRKMVDAKKAAYQLGRTRFNKSARAVEVLKKTNGARVTL